MEDRNFFADTRIGMAISMVVLLGIILWIYTEYQKPIDDILKSFSGVTALECNQGFNFGGEDETALIGCSSPQFLIACDARTLQIFSQKINCKSNDGKNYEITSKEEISTNR